MLALSVADWMITGRLLFPPEPAERLCAGADFAKGWPVRRLVLSITTIGFC
jgi:hypothetical protein